MSLDILYMYGSFSGVSKKYIAYNFGNFSDTDLDSAKSEGERLEGNDKSEDLEW